MAGGGEHNFDAGPTAAEAVWDGRRTCGGADAGGVFGSAVRKFGQVGIKPELEVRLFGGSDRRNYSWEG